MAKTVALYIRLSKEDDDVKSSIDKLESNSIKNQRMVLQDYVQSHDEFNGYKIIEKVDDGFSGSIFDRPAFNELIEMAKRQEIQCIIVKDMSRFGRNYIEVGDYLEQIFPFLGIRFISINDHYDSQSMGNKTAGLDVAFRNFVYDAYSKDTSKKIRSTRAKLAREGKFASANAPYGYQKDPKDKHHLIPNPETAPIVRKIFVMRLKGITSRQITRYLNRQEIPSPAQYALDKGVGMDWRKVNEMSAWNDSKVNAILRDECYAGNMVSLRRGLIGVRGKDKKVDKEHWVRVENTHKGIVTMDEFSAVQELLPSYEKENNQERYFNPYVCGCCGRKLSKTKNKKHYFCRYGDSNPKANCYEAKFLAAELDDVIWEEMQWHFKRFLKLDQVMKQSLKQKQTEKELIQDIKKMIKKIEKNNSDMYEAYRAGEISKEEYLKKKTDNKKQLEQYNEQLQKQKKTVKVVEEKKQQNQTVRELVEHYMNEHKLIKEMQRVFIEKVEVYSEQRIKIVWKFSDVFERTEQ